MLYRHTFLVQAPLSAVAAFHRKATNVKAITPPPAFIQVHAAPDYLSNGDQMKFTMWFGPLSIRWKAQFEDVSPTSFTDRQVQGPFKKWVHRRRFVPVSETTTEVVDQIEGQFRRHPLWLFVGLGMWLSLPLLFAYRGWKTRRFLQRDTASYETA